MNRTEIPAQSRLATLLDSQANWLLCLLVGIGCRVLLALHTPYWLDELWSATFSHPSFTLHGVVERTVADVHPPLFQMALYGWYQLFGFTELSGRMLSLLAGIAAIPLFYHLAEELYDKRTARIGTLLFALSPLAVGFSSEVRSYETLLLLTILSTLFLARTLQRGGWANHAGYFLSALAIAYTHYFGIILLVCHFITLLAVTLKSRNVKTLGSVLGVYLLLLACYLPMLHAVMSNLARPEFWITNPTFTELLLYIPWYYAGPFAIPLFLLLGWIAYRNRQQLGFREALLCSSVLIILFVPWLLGFLISPVMTLRNAIIFLPFITLLFAHLTTMATARQGMAVIGWSLAILAAAVNFSMVNKGEALDKLLTAVQEKPAPLYFPNEEAWTVEYFTTKIQLNGSRYADIQPQIMESKNSEMPDTFWLACYHKCYLLKLDEWIPAGYSINETVQGRGVEGYLLRRSNHPRQ
jgi:4-amino-4-deoxy-L-arabinose transferase-like glycosyltransferase